MRRFSELSAPRRKLVQIMQEVNFGRIKRIVVCEHEPRVDAAMLYQKDFKPGGDNGARPEATLSDFRTQAAGDGSSGILRQAWGSEYHGHRSPAWPAD